MLIIFLNRKKPIPDMFLERGTISIHCLWHLGRLHLATDKQINY